MKTGLVVLVCLGGCGAAGEADPVDAGSPDAPSCGDGVVSGDEVCDGAAQACVDLGGSWSAGTAPCRSDCRGWDPGECTLAAPGYVESVKPAMRDPRWEDARCNDGLPFSFVVRVAPDSETWMIYLEGGVFCDDFVFACDERDVRLTTTSPLPDRATAPNIFGGLASDDPSVNPDFAGANMVFARYCSSDMWSGATTERRPSSGHPDGWYFSGRRNVAAMFEILVERYGLSDSSPDLRVLFGGGSAGSHGAHFNAETAESILPGAAAGGRLMIFNDAGWMFDWDEPEYRMQGVGVSDREAWRLARDFWGGAFDAACEAAHDDPIDCFFGPGWYATLSARLPVFVQQSRQDSSYGVMLHGVMPGTPGMDEWQAQAEASLAGVAWLHSGSATYHVLALADDGLGVGPPGSTLGEMVSRFWNGSAPERVLF
jgi:hypothetical protein